MMRTKWNAAVCSVAVLLTLTIITSTAFAGAVTFSLPGQKGGVLHYVNHKGEETIQQHRARQENRKRLIKQLQEQRKLKVEQLLLIQRQRNLTKKHQQNQTSQTRHFRLQERQPEVEEMRRRNSLVDEQHNNQAQLAQKNEEAISSRQLQRKKQEQNVKKRFPALMRYYESLGRRILRAQKDRTELPGTSVP